MKPLDSILFDFIRTYNDSIGGVPFELFKNFLILWMKLQDRHKLSIPTIKFHDFLIIINLILSEIQPFSLKGVVNARLILSDQLPAYDWGCKFKPQFRVTSLVARHQLRQRTQAEKFALFPHRILMFVVINESLMTFWTALTYVSLAF